MKVAQTQHTPGPYRLWSVVMDGYRPIMAPDGVILALVSARSPNSEETGMVLAAAPELQDALRGMMKLRAPDLLTNKERADIINAAVDALAKAEGR